MRIFRHKVKYRDLPVKTVENEAKLIICKTCNIRNILPQHHGRDMVKSEKKLICWRKMLSGDDLEPCEEEFPLFCPNCKNELELI